MLVTALTASADSGPGSGGAVTEPAPAPDFTLGDRYDINFIDLPASVTSQTTTGVAVPDVGGVRIRPELQAASDAALGNAAITVRATGGGVAHTLKLPITWLGLCYVPTGNE